MVVLANLFSLFTRRTTAEDYHRAFVVDVRPVVPREPRSRRTEQFIAVGWVLVALKCWGVWWLVEHYHLPVRAWWINGPTLAAATLTTVVYLRRP